MTLHKRFILFAAAALVLAQSAIAIYARIGERDEAAGGVLGDSSAALPDVSATAAFSTNQPIPVEGATVLLDTLVLHVRAEGQAAAWRQTTVLAQVAGQVQRVLVAENRAIGPGTPLVVIDSTEYALAAAKACARSRGGAASRERVHAATVRCAFDSLRNGCGSTSPLSTLPR